MKSALFGSFVSHRTPLSPLEPVCGSGRCCQVLPPSVVSLIVADGLLLPPLSASRGLVGCIAAAGSTDPGVLDILRAGPHVTSPMRLGCPPPRGDPLSPEPVEGFGAA